MFTRESREKGETQENGRKHQDGDAPQGPWLAIRQVDDTDSYEEESRYDKGLPDEVTQGRGRRFWLVVQLDHE
jgi:hypothetical protein